MSKKKRGGPHNLAEIYTSMTPDLFNYAFNLDPILYDYLRGETHVNFMKMWNSVERGFGKSSAYGFICHNDVWGVDSTAHHNSRTLDPSEGYIVTKAIQLDNILMNISAEYAGLGLTDAIRIELAHNVVEAAGDILITRLDPRIGQKIVASAIRPNQVFRDLLLRTYAPGLAFYDGSELAVQIILGGEGAFRNAMIAYGTVFQQDEATAISLITQDFSNLAQLYLAANGVTLPPKTDLPLLVTAAMNIAISICETGVLTEVKATLRYVNRQLKNYLTDDSE